MCRFATVILLALLVSRALVLCDAPVLEIDSDRDTVYLPYSIELSIQQTERPGEYIAIHPFRVVKPATPSQPGSYIRWVVPASTEDSHPYPLWTTYPQDLILDEHPMPGIYARDIAVYPMVDSLMIFGTFIRGDSAFLFKYHAPGGATKFLCAGSGTDQTGDSLWQAHFTHRFTGDVDGDGNTEMLFFLNPVRDSGLRELLCIDVDRLIVKWRVSCPASPYGSTFIRGEGTGIELVFATEAPGQGFACGNLNDGVGYVMRLDEQGRILSADAKTRYPKYAMLVESEPRGDFIAISNVTTVDSLEIAVVEVLDGSGSYHEVFRDTSIVQDAFLMDYTGDNRKELYLLGRNGSHVVLDSAYQPMARFLSQGVLSFVTIIPAFDGHSNAVAISEPTGGVGIFNARFEKLCQLPFCARIAVLGRGHKGEVTALALSDTRGNVWTARVTHRGFLGYIAIVYRRNQVYVLAALVGLLAATVVSNYYRRRVSGQKRQLEEVHRELAVTHEALKRAQETIVAHEKYRQAKDIAGGFAHEIRNALFPADSALTKLSELADTGSLAGDQLEKYLTNVGTSISRAVGITKLISHYTKLDTQHVPEKVDLAMAVRHTVTLNQSVIEQNGIAVTQSGSDNVFVHANGTQLGMALNNLLGNAVDALTNQTTPTIIIKWERLGEWVQLTVSDNGCGIAADSLPRVFDAFYSTKPNRGTGLGLSITRKIVEMYGGTIEASSAPEKGSLFTVRLRPYDE